MNILVTGGAGYIGSVLVPALLDKNHNVTVVDNFLYKQTSLSGYVRSKNLKIVQGDVRNVGLVSENLKNADVIIPLAAIVGAPACAKDPIAASSVNRDAVVRMFDKISKFQQIIMPTTNSAYGSGNAENYCDEESPLKPLSLYAKDKVEVEKHLLELTNSTSLRLATVFGISPRMRLDLLVNNFVLRATTDGFIIVFEGNFKRNYIHLVDVVQAFELAIENPELVRNQIFNVGLSSANISKLELCELIKDKLPNFIFKESEIGSDPDQRNYIVSNAKIEKLGFKPKISLSEGLDELISNISMFDQRPFTNL
mgnify:CR=1 FL=1